MYVHLHHINTRIHASTNMTLTKTRIQSLKSSSCNKTQWELKGWWWQNTRKLLPNLLVIVRFARGLLSSEIVLANEVHSEQQVLFQLPRQHTALWDKAKLQYMLSYICTYILCSNELRRQKAASFYSGDLWIKRPCNIFLTRMSFETTTIRHIYMHIKRILDDYHSNEHKYCRHMYPFICHDFFLTTLQVLGPYFILPMRVILLFGNHYHCYNYLPARLTISHTPLPFNGTAEGF